MAYLEACLRKLKKDLLIRASNIIAILADNERYLNYPAFGFDEKRLFETYRIVIEPQGSLQARARPQGTQEFHRLFRAGQNNNGLDSI
ncbi:MAG: hypothetical protein SOT13_01670 [Candidatus Aphodousia sp.]|nr:hypothetical protein [Sutterella sp.]MDY2899222.1 hypothetical protein [Candidatus Aphodousia sp.]